MEKKMNNKGFSMVELIIVIAIMAVLIVVAAPQYLKFVERGRNSTDMNNAAAIESALLVWGSDLTAGTGTTTAYTVDATGTTLTVAPNVDIAFSGANVNAAKDALKNASISETTRCQSKTAWTSYTVTVKVESDGSVKVSTSYATPTP